MNYIQTVESKILLPFNRHLGKILNVLLIVCQNGINKETMYERNLFPMNLNGIPSIWGFPN